MKLKSDAHLSSKAGSKVDQAGRKSEAGSLLSPLHFRPKGI